MNFLQDKEKVLMNSHMFSKLKFYNWKYVYCTKCLKNTRCSKILNTTDYQNKKYNMFFIPKQKKNIKK